MDYSYLAAPAAAQPYPFFTLPGKDNQYTPQEELQNNPLDAYNDPNTFQFFDQSSFNHSNLIPQPSQSPPISLPQTSVPPPLPYDGSGTISQEAIGDQEFEQAQRQGSSDEEKESLTPAQSRRKAQNRAAQRAFRERKERHVKELELKLKSMEAQMTDVMSERERLKRENERMATQNEILRATSTPMRASHDQPQSQQNRDAGHSHSPEPGMASGPMVYSPSTFNAAFANHNNPGGQAEPISHRVAISPATGERLLATGAAWELIQSHELTRMGRVDLGDVVDRLREKVLCDGSGPTFTESAVIEAIEDSAGSAGDELI